MGHVVKCESSVFMWYLTCNAVTISGEACVRVSCICRHNLFLNIWTAAFKVQNMKKMYITGDRNEFGGQCAKSKITIINSLNPSFHDGLWCFHSHGESYQGDSIRSPFSSLFPMKSSVPGWKIAVKSTWNRRYFIIFQGCSGLLCWVGVFRQSECPLMTNLPKREALWVNWIHVCTFQSRLSL